MTAIMPIRTAPAVKRVQTPQNYEKVKSFFPKVAQKILYVKCGGSGSPPPDDWGNKIKVWDNISKVSKYTPEKLAMINSICKGNNFTKKSIIMNDTSKYLKF